MFWVYAIAVLLLNACWWAVSLIGVPGTWLMIGTVAVLDWWQRDRVVVALETWVIVIGLAVLGEVIELIAGAMGARKFGGGRWASLGALLGGVAGAVVGTFMIHVPLFGTILGAVIGAFAGAMGLELATGKSQADAIRAGRGAALGHVAGNLTKFAIGGVIYIILAIAIVRP